MSTVSIVLLFLFMVGMSSILVRLLPLPLPLVQIGLGAVLAAIPWHGIHVSLDPEIFLLLFIPPLLFSDGWRIPKRELYREKSSVLMLAFGLVFFTIGGAGYFIHWLIPAISLPAAFALAAVLSPTDAVAVSAISGRVRIPPRLMYLLQGESLLNDASGLVAFKFALAAAMTGMFSLKAAAGEFVYVALGGLVVGVVLAFGIGWGRHRIARWRGESPGTHIILTLLLPFASYLAAEHIGVSGILAAVAAGLTMNYTTFARHSSLETRIQSSAIWGLLEMAFNGVIFILLGLQLPDIFRKAPQDALEAGHSSVWMLLWYVFAIMTALFLLRFVWVWVSLKLTMLRATLQKKPLPASMSWRLIVGTCLAGVRGAVTLAGVLSIPLFIREGVPFPGRDLMIFLATSVILLSLVAASFGLPFLLKNIQMPTESAQEERRMAQRLATTAAIEKLAEEKKASPQQTDPATAVLRGELCQNLINTYRRRFDSQTGATSTGDAYATEKQIRLLALHAERERIEQLYTAHVINNQTFDALLKDLDMREAALSGTDIGHF